MATKTKTPPIKPTLLIKEEVLTKHDKEKKEPGNTFWLKELPEEIPMRKYMIPDRTSFEECNDGSYQVYLDGERLHFRFVAARISAMEKFLSKQVNTI